MVFRVILILLAHMVALTAFFGCTEAKDNTVSWKAKHSEHQSSSFFPDLREKKAMRERALGDELSETVKKFSGVASARVHIVLSDRSLFSEDREIGSSAAVLLSELPGEAVKKKEVVDFLVTVVPDLENDDVKIFVSMPSETIKTAWVGPVEVISTSKKTAQFILGVLLGLCVLFALGLIYLGFRLRKYK